MLLTAILGFVLGVVFTCIWVLSLKIGSGIGNDPDHILPPGVVEFYLVYRKNMNKL